MVTMSDAYMQTLQAAMSTGAGGATTAAILVDGQAAIEFNEWKGSIQLCMPVIEAVTRLGASRLVITNVKKQSLESSCRATKVYANEADLDNDVVKLYSYVGEKISIRTDSAKVIENCYIKFFTFAKTATTSGTYNWKLVLELTILQDEAPKDSGAN
jgi:hypothetical protein